MPAVEGYTGERHEEEFGGDIGFLQSGLLLGTTREDGEILKLYCSFILYCVVSIILYCVVSKW